MHFFMNIILLILVIFYFTNRENAYNEIEEKVSL